MTHRQAEDDAEDCRRTIWFVVEGIHARDGQGGVRQSKQSSEKSFHRRITDDVSTPAAGGQRVFDRTDNVIRAMFYGWARTHGGREQKFHQSSAKARKLRAGLLRL